jgi:hypothetical protein
VPYVRRSVDTATTLTVEGETLRFGTDFLPAQGGGTARAIDGATAIYGGALGAEGLPGLTAEQTAGRIVVVQAQTLANLRQLTSLPALQGAAGVALVLLDQLPPQFRRSSRARSSPSTRPPSPPPARPPAPRPPATHR